MMKNEKLSSLQHCPSRYKIITSLRLVISAQDLTRFKDRLLHSVIDWSKFWKFNQSQT